MRLIKRRDRPTPLSLLLDLALSVVAIYSACLLTAEVLTTDGSADWRRGLRSSSS
jgi:hypothetical protein